MGENEQRVDGRKEGKTGRALAVAPERTRACEPAVNVDLQVRPISEQLRGFKSVYFSPDLCKKTGAMDVFKAVETYITKMVSEPSAMKVLLLDTHTVRGHMLPALAAQELTAGWLCRHQ